MGSNVLRVVSANGTAHLAFEVSEGEFAVILTAGGADKDRAVKMLSFGQRYEGVDIYFRGRLTGRAGEAEADAMRAQVKVFCGDSLDPATGTYEPFSTPLVILDIADAKFGAIPTDTVLRFAKRVCQGGAAMVVLTPDPSLALQADSVYRLRGDGIYRIVG